MEITHPEDRRNFGNDSKVITWLEQSDFHVISTHIHQDCNVVLFESLFSRMSFFYNVTQAISSKPRRIGIFTSYWNKFSGSQGNLWFSVWRFSQVSCLSTRQGDAIYRVCVVGRAGRIGCCPLMLYICKIRCFGWPERCGYAREIWAFHGCWLGHYVHCLAVWLHTNQASRTQRNRGGRDRVVIDCSWRLKRCGQAVELVVIGCGSILDWSVDVVRIYRLYLLAWLGRLCVLCMHVWASFACVLQWGLVGLLGCCSLMSYICQIRCFFMWPERCCYARDIRTFHGCWCSIVADYVHCLAVWLRTNQASRTQRNRGRRGRVAIDGSWRLKGCGQVVELVVIGCGSILDWSEDVVRIYRLYLFAWLGRLCVLCMHVWASFVCCCEGW